MVPSDQPAPGPRTKRRLCRRLTDVEVAALVAGYVAGLPIDELVEEFQVDQTTVQKYVRQNGVARRSERLGSRQREEAVSLYLAGRSTASIAGELRVGATTVRRALVGAGVVLRQRGRPPNSALSD
jgi:DNA-directed RNA polymerase specialized sigma24 family protein